MMNEPKILAALLAAAAAACTTLTVPPVLVPADGQYLMTVPARGVQIYECRTGAGGTAAWAFVAPEAELFDSRGRHIGKHGAGPTWTAADGSTLRGSVKQRADAPGADAIPWLLLDAKAGGPQGLFSKVTSIQRINTAGGVAPVNGCSAAQAGAAARVPYTADYVLFAAR